LIFGFEAWACEATLGVVINEFMADPTGTDGDHEWIELYNASGVDVDVSGWELQGGSSSYSSFGFFPEGTILIAGSYYLVGDVLVETDLGMVPDAVLSMSLGNASSNADAVRLLDCTEQVMDTVVYGNTLNPSDPWVDDLGNVPTSFAPKPSSGQSTARSPNGSDSNDSGVDFVIQDPSPKEENDLVADGICDATLGVVINEFMADPAGTDGDHEWVELYNGSGVDVDVSGWTLQGGSSSYSSFGTLPEGLTLLAGSYLLIGDELVESDLGMVPDVLMDISLGNASSNADAIQLVDCIEQVIDTVIYGDVLNESDPWVDDLGNVPTSFAPKPSSGQSTVRSPNGVDSNDSGIDFVIQSPSPNAENIASSGEEGEITCDATFGVVINEFVADPAGSDTDREWIELYNGSGVDVDISGWELQGGARSYSSFGSLPADTILLAGAYLLVGDELVEMDLGIAPDVQMSMSLGNAGSNTDAIRLTDCTEQVMDTVIYGDTFNGTDPWLDDQGILPDFFAPKPSSGQSTGRVPNGVDSDILVDDFVVLNFVSPKQPNDVVQSCEGEEVVKINEFLPNPEGDDATFEWVELFNNSSSDIDMEGWSLQWGTSSYSNSFLIPEGAVIPANGYLLIGGEGVVGADVVASADEDISMGAASSSGDALRLLHCGPGISDTVIYGPTSEEGIAENTDEWEEDDGAIAFSIAPKAVSGISISRRIDGVDTDISGEDFMISVENTPGETNPEVQCYEDNGTIKINEIFPNPDGSDSGSEWIELYNTGSEDVRLDSWTIESASSSWSTRFIFPPETTIEAGSYFLIGEELVPSEFADITMDSTLSLGNASTGFDGVRMKDCPGNVVDTILYGKENAYASVDEILFVDDAGGESVTIFPDSGLSIGRYPDGADSDDNGVDFQSNMEPSPKAANIENGAEAGDTGEIEIPQKGCSREPSEDGGPSKCSYVYGIPNAAWFAFLFVLLRRRER
jgi:hypothetical protein